MQYLRLRKQRGPGRAQAGGHSAGREAGPTKTLDEIVTALLTASRALVGVSARSLAGVEDAVTLTQFRTLVVLQAHGPTSLNRLADRLEVSRPPPCAASTG